ncbi:SGT1 [Fusarium albosuccineum]|uniref:SGT1 n=1 Tax=Fusarium albosuccineum TaxID=1237068 RepID=A0A8H4LK91_9HYPO|nr:SGT1 [Fusarium albosuccineum]
MSHITLGQQGLAAAEARDWDLAIRKLSIALDTSKNPLWLIARSKAFINKTRFQEALDDADSAWHSAYERNKRPLLVEAHYRRAVAYFRLKQYANADACCVWAMRLVKGFPAVEKEDPVKLRTDENGFYSATLEEAQQEANTDEINKTERKDAIAVGDKGPAQAKEWRTASTLRMQILFAMNKLEKDDEARKLTTSQKPELNKPRPTIEELHQHRRLEVFAKTTLDVQEFQSNANMSVSIFTKGVDKEKLKVEYKPFSVHLDSVIYPNGDMEPYTLDLWGEIDPSESKHTVTPNKVELSLKKKVPGKWKQLKAEPKEEPKAVEDAAAAEEAEKLKILKDARKKAMDAADKPAEDKGKTVATEASKSAAHTYPTSSRTGPKNWDNLGDDESDDDKEDVNGFFKKLYKGASPEQQRAMMKSFTESNGTSLSTDWGDVKDRHVDTVPPDGVEAKKW